jgi:hypothetical protein
MLTHKDTSLVLWFAVKCFFSGAIQTFPLNIIFQELQLGTLQYNKIRLSAKTVLSVCVLCTYLLYVRAK